MKCDRTTMTQTDIDNGRLICVIGVAPVKAGRICDYPHRPVDGARGRLKEEGD